MKGGRAALGRSTPHFSVILSRLPVIGDLHPIGGRLNTSLLDPGADPFGQLRFEGLVQLCLQLAHPIARGIERRIQVPARGIARGSIGQLHTGALDRDVIKEDPDDNHILACALAGEANLIVSRDLDLLRLKTYGTIGIVSPIDFLHTLEGFKKAA